MQGTARAMDCASVPGMGNTGDHLIAYFLSSCSALQNASHCYVADFCASSSLKMLARIFPRLDCDVFFMNIESRTKLIGKLLGILLLLKEH